MSSTSIYTPEKRVELFRKRIDHDDSLINLLAGLNGIDAPEDAYVSIETEQDWDGYPEEYFVVYVDVPMTEEEIESDWDKQEDDIHNQIIGLQRQLNWIKKERNCG